MTNPEPHRGVLPENATAPAGPFAIQCRVIHALILRDIRTRFFGHGLGFVIAIAWPLAHMGVLMIIYTAVGRAAPYGDSLALFLSSGLVPVLMFQYMSRFIVMAPILNRPLLAFPVVRLLDVLFARALLELLGACCGTLIVFYVMLICGIDAVPIDIGQAYSAMAASLMLGLGLGMLNGLIAFVQPMWATAYSLLLIVLYISSGILYVPSALPETLRNIVSYNPILHGVEWLRTAYYIGYPTLVLDRAYLLECGIFSVFLALIVERLFRARLLES